MLLKDINAFRHVSVGKTRINFLCQWSWKSGLGSALQGSECTVKIYVMKSIRERACFLFLERYFQKILQDLDSQFKGKWNSFIFCKWNCWSLLVNSWLRRKVKSTNQLQTDWQFESKNQGQDQQNVPCCWGLRQAPDQGEPANKAFLLQIQEASSLQAFNLRGHFNYPDVLGKQHKCLWAIQALEQISQRNCGFPIPGSVHGQSGWGFD